MPPNWSSGQSDGVWYEWDGGVVGAFVEVVQGAYLLEPGVPPVLPGAKETPVYVGCKSMC